MMALDTTRPTTYRNDTFIDSSTSSSVAVAAAAVTANESSSVGNVIVTNSNERYHQPAAPAPPGETFLDATGKFLFLFLNIENRQ